MFNARQANQQGFTLTELMVVLAVFGILASIAVPSFRDFTQSQQIKNASMELFPSLTLARSEALKRNTDVTLLPTSTSDWSQGWKVCVNCGASNEVLIKTQAALKGVQIIATNTPASVIYASNGRLSSTAQIKFQIDAANSSTATDKVRCVKIDLSGLPRSSKGVC